MKKMPYLIILTVVTLLFLQGCSPVTLTQKELPPDGLLTEPTQPVIRIINEDGSVPNPEISRYMVMLEAEVEISILNYKRYHEWLTKHKTSAKAE